MLKRTLPGSPHGCVQISIGSPSFNPISVRGLDMGTAI